MLRARGLSLFFLGLFTIAGCDGDPMDPDGGGIDAGTTPQDDAGPGDDAGPPMEDAGPVEDDGGPAGEDAGPAEDDAGALADAGRPDGGSAGADAGTDAGPPPGCADGMRNGDETDVDCGGEVCAPCEAMEACMGGSDCVSRVCIGGECQAASCNDGIRNGSETDRDCGGPDCAGCELGRMCMGIDDCADATAMCTGGFCQPGACSDGMQNNGETDVDCGGGTCAPCSDGDACELGRDCASGLCESGVCVPATCANGMMDAGEVGLDCGGSCPGCPDGTACTTPADCASGRCEGGLCTSCNDGMMNGAETDVDCGGGVCEGCPAGSMCVDASDCLFGQCLTTGCNGPSEYYRETFEGSDGGWTVGGTNPSWEYGEPANTVIDAAYGGTSAWVTSLGGDYNTSEDSWIESPVIDLSTATADPVLELAIRYETESCCDEAWVEVSIDGGSSWSKLGERGSGNNWYNDFADYWNGSSGQWRVASHPLTGTAGEPTVQVRVRMDSDGSIQREGIAIDDVVVRDRIPVNLATTVENVPDVCGAVALSVTNIGDDTVGSYTFEYGVGSAGSSEMLTDLAPGASETRVLYGTAGDMAFARAIVADDLDPTDNEASTTVALDARVVDGSMPYEESFDADDGGWTVAGSNPSWAHGAPAGSVIDAADSGSSAWVTTLDGDYNSDEQSYLISPCIDASGASADLQVSFAQVFETESCCDEGYLEYSADGGLSWSRVEGGAAASNWYAETSDGWAGSSSGWRTASATLPGTANKPQVRLRFVMSSDSSVQDEGFGLDTLRLESTGEVDIATELRRTATCGVAEAVVSNVGTTTIGAYALTIEVDGDTRRQTVIESLLPGDAIAFPVEGTGRAVVTARAPGDVDTSNDSSELFITIPLTGGFAEDFDADDGGFTVSGTNASWEHGEPSGSFISGPASGTGAWVTGLSGSYDSDELSYLTSPCFDFSALSSDPTLAFSHIYQTESCCDRGWIEVSTDGGATWNKLGTASSGTNWYDDGLLDWWNGTSGPPGIWRMAMHPMTGTAGASSVRFRFVMFSDGGVEADGFGVDDVTLSP